MSLHDQYARLTPFEIAFPDRTPLAALSDRVARETRERGADDTQPEAFVTTEAVGELVRQMRSPDAPPESSYPFASLIYHGVHFLRAGCPLYLLGTGAVRRLTERSMGAAPPSSAVEPPRAAGYLQLPQHLVWTSGGSSGGPASRGTPESLDGVFWTVSGSAVLHALPITGLLPDRPGFGAVPLPGAPVADAWTWLEVDVRPSGDDFASTLPGGEIDALYSVEAAGEILKLLARFFALVRTEPGRLEERPAGTEAGAEPPAPPRGRREPEGRGAGPPGGPRPSALPYTRVSLEE